MTPVRAIHGSVRHAPLSSCEEARSIWVCLLGGYVREQRIGHTLTAPADIELEEDSTVAPDVFVIPRTAGPRPVRWSEITTLLLAVEVLSPSTARADRVRERRYFTRNQVPQYWIVDCDARVVEVWQPAAKRPLIHDTEVMWKPVGAGEPFVLDLTAYFRDVFGEE